MDGSNRTAVPAGMVSNNATATSPRGVTTVCNLIPFTSLPRGTIVRLFC
nr:MAG TPA: hypothetical protein [Bacteriophage sp.]